MRAFMRVAQWSHMPNGMSWSFKLTPPSTSIAQRVYHCTIKHSGSHARQQTTNNDKHYDDDKDERHDNRWQPIIHSIEHKDSFHPRALSFLFFLIDLIYILYFINFVWFVQTNTYNNVLCIRSDRWRIGRGDRNLICVNKYSSINYYHMWKERAQHRNARSPSHTHTHIYCLR